MDPENHIHPWADCPEQLKHPSNLCVQQVYKICWQNWIILYSQVELVDNVFNCLSDISVIALTLGQLCPNNH